MQDKIEKIPVLGRLFRIINAFIHAPERFENIQRYLREDQQRLETQGEKLNAQISELRMLQEEWRGVLNRLQRLEDPDYLDVHHLIERIYSNEAEIQMLNLQLSIHPTIWGDPARLHISEKASVFPCFFNTNSGEITIGDYTFAGSHVSILAGSHDMRLQGLARRDVDIVEGCDIVIGQGVWLASGCTVLGPCIIEDNAVIAAGAVVTPGTRVPAHTLFGGIPAREIKKMGQTDLPWGEDAAIRDAIRRERGILFVEGWSAKDAATSLGRGHWLFSRGKILVDQSRWHLSYDLPEGRTCRLLMDGSAGQISEMLSGKQGEKEISLPVPEGAIGEVDIRIIEGEEKVFLTFSRPGEFRDGGTFPVSQANEKREKGV